MGYGKKVEKNKIIYMTGCFVALLAITYLVFNIIDGLQKYKESNMRLEASIASLKKLENQYEGVQKLKALEQSSTGYEMHIRSKFDLNKADENAVFIITEDTPTPIKQENGIEKIIHKFKNFFN